MIRSMLSSVFICLSTSVVIECYPFNCSLIKPNDVYKGIGLTERFEVDGTRSDWLNNRQGLEWKIEFYKTNDGTIGLKMDEKSVMKVNKEMAQRFGIFYRVETESQTGNCEVNVRNVNSTIDCGLHYEKQGKYWDATQTINISSTDDRTLSLKPFPSRKASPDSAYLLVVKQEDKKERKLLKFKLNSTLFRENCSVVPSLCWNISFIDQISDELFKQIDSIVEYNISGFGFGHVLWFNINGRPKYCLQRENASLADNSVDNLSDVPDVDHCLSSSDDGIPFYLWIIIAIIVVLVLIIIAIVILIFISRKNKMKVEEESSSSAAKVKSTPLERFRRNVQRKYKDESSVIGSNLSDDSLTQTDLKPPTNVNPKK